VSEGDTQFSSIDPGPGFIPAYATVKASHCGGASASRILNSPTSPPRHARPRHRGARREATTSRRQSRRGTVHLTPHCASLSGDTVVAFPIGVKRRLLPGKFLPAPYDHVAILRLSSINRAWRPPSRTRSTSCQTRRRHQAPYPGPCCCCARRAHQLHRLHRRVQIVDVRLLDEPHVALVAGPAQKWSAPSFQP